MRLDNARLHRVQAKKLQHDEEQEKMIPIVLR